MVIIAQEVSPEAAMDVLRTAPGVQVPLPVHRCRWCFVVVQKLERVPEKMGVS